MALQTLPELWYYLTILKYLWENYFLATAPKFYRLFSQRVSNHLSEGRRVESQKPHAERKIASECITFCVCTIKLVINIFLLQSSCSMYFFGMGVLKPKQRARLLATLVGPKGHRIHLEIVLMEVRRHVMISNILVRSRPNWTCTEMTARAGTTPFLIWVSHTHSALFACPLERWNIIVETKTPLSIYRKQKHISYYFYIYNSLSCKTVFLKFRDGTIKAKRLSDWVHCAKGTQRTKYSSLLFFPVSLVYTPNLGACCAQTGFELLLIETNLTNMQTHSALYICYERRSSPESMPGSSARLNLKSHVVNARGMRKSCRCWVNIMCLVHKTFKRGDNGRVPPALIAAICGARAAPMLTMEMERSFVYSLITVARRVICNTMSAARQQP